MISNRVYTAMGIVFCSLSYFGLMPFEWDWDRRKFTSSPEVNRSRFRIHAFLISAYIPYSFSLAIYYKIQGDLDLFVSIYVLGALDVIIFELILIALFFEDELLTFSNGLFRYLEFMNRKQLN